jgi:hypothetical protein
MIHDYESFAFVSDRQPALFEMYSGQEIVGWQGRIERQLVELADQYEEARNPGYADKIRVFLQTWRKHQLTGSLNVEVIDALLAATEVPAVDPWKLQNYFSNLRDQLRRLKASVEELPLDAYGAARNTGAPPMPEPSGGEEAPPETAPAEETAPPAETPAT